MDAISLADAKARLSDLVSRAEAGETVEITRRGRPVARLTPIEQPRKRVDMAMIEALTAKLSREDDGTVDTVGKMRAAARY